MKSKGKFFKSNKSNKVEENNSNANMNQENLNNQETQNETEILSENDNQKTAEVAEENKPEQESAIPGQVQNKEGEYQQQIKDLNDKYIRLMAEFDNFRKRTLKERMELLKSAGEDILVNILPVVDDFERGIQAIDKSDDIESVKQGIHLIYNKFKDFLSQRGVKEIEAMQQDFNVDIHDAITKIPAPEENLKGKVVDVVQKGYYLNEKVIRFAKVVVGE
jgi:molecular chaperone GrpE